MSLLGTPCIAETRARLLQHVRHATAQRLVVPRRSRRPMQEQGMCPAARSQVQVCKSHCDRLIRMHSQAHVGRLQSQSSCGSAASTSYGTVHFAAARSQPQRSQRRAFSLAVEPARQAQLPCPTHPLASGSRLQRQHPSGRPILCCAYQHDVVGLAQAMVDFGATVDDAFLASFHVEKGGRRCEAANCSILLKWRQSLAWLVILVYF